VAILNSHYRTVTPIYEPNCDYSSLRAESTEHDMGYFDSLETTADSNLAGGNLYYEYLGYNPRIGTNLGA
jgi:hypothetical protein